MPGASRFTDERTLREFAEQGQLESRYQADPGPGVEAALTWRFARRLAVSGAASRLRRKQAGSYAAALPHPLYIGAPRHAGGDFDDRSLHETAVHLDLAVVGGRRLEWTVFAGPSAIAIRAELLHAVQYTHAYPYDTVTVTGTSFESTRASAIGFNAGGGLDWQLARHVAIGAQTRYRRAAVHLPTTSGEHVRVEAAGLELTGGLRLDF